MAARDFEPLPGPEQSEEFTQTEQEDQESAWDEAGCCTYCCFMLFGFCAFWFGAELVDVNKDNKYDIQDAKILLHKFRKGRLDDYLANKADVDGDGDIDLFEQETDMANLDHNKVTKSKSGTIVTPTSYADFMTKIPYFIIIQTTFAFFAWFIGMLYNCALAEDHLAACPLGATNNVAGLKTIFGSMAMLSFHDDDCNSTRLQFWRWIVYQWTHTSFAHISMNVFMNLFLGLPLGAFNGWMRMLVMYNSGVIGGALFVALFDVHSTVVGMSGGCYALIGMKFADIFLNWGQKTFRKMEIGFLVVLCLVDTLYALNFSRSNSPVASGACHLGGLLAGWVFGLVISKNLREDPWERWVKWITVALAIILYVGAFFYLQFLGWPPSNMNSSEPGWCYLRQVNERATFGDDGWHCVFCGDEACMSFWNSKPWVYPVTNMQCQSMNEGHTAGWNVYGISEGAMFTER